MSRRSTLTLSSSTQAEPTTIKWRNAGGVHDLVIQPSEALRRVVDEEELAESVAKINRELYETEDRVAALESAPAPTPGGGGGGAEINDLGDYTTTQATLISEVQDTGVAVPTTGRFLMVEVVGEEDILWYRRAHFETVGVPMAGTSQNGTVYITSIRALRLGRTGQNTGNFALAGGFSSDASIIQAGTTLRFSTFG